VTGVPEPSDLDLLVELSVAAVAAADEGAATAVDGDDPVARRVHRVVDAIAAARRAQAAP
jgi:hypothetical protein